MLVPPAPIRAPLPSSQPRIPAVREMLRGQPPTIATIFHVIPDVIVPVSPVIAMRLGRLTVVWGLRVSPDWGVRCLQRRRSKDAGHHTGHKSWVSHGYL